jgi:hypothetical protein
MSVPGRWLTLTNENELKETMTKLSQKLDDIDKRISRFWWVLGGVLVGFLMTLAVLVFMLFILMFG